MSKDCQFTHHFRVIPSFTIGQILLAVGGGDFYTPEEAMERQKHFRQSDRFINEQPTEAMRSEVRNYAIELVEKLPESMLDEAIEVLESLYVKTNHLK